MPDVTAHPRFAAHFTDPVYADITLDSAPFGSDQGADMFHDVEMAGGVLPGDDIQAVLPFGDVQGFLADADKGDVDGLLFIYAAGFLLLYFRAHLAESDYRILRRALVALADDLESLSGPDADAIRSTVLPDLDSFMTQGTGA